MLPWYRTDQNHARVFRRVENPSPGDLCRRTRFPLPDRVLCSQLRFIDGTLESLECFPDPYTQLRQLPRAENNQDNEQDEQKFHPSE